MCYYSKTLRSDQFRGAKEGEDLRISDDIHGHHFAQGVSDGKVVCLMDHSTVHIAKLEFNPHRRREVLNYDPKLRELEGKPVTAQFKERRGQVGYSFDCLLIEGRELHFVYLAVGTQFYIGPKKVDVADTLGVNDPSIALDHRTDVAPTHGETLAKLEPVSIQR